jgi:hydroxyacylglutathione hydrolase
VEKERSDRPMKIDSIAVGPIMTNCYILQDAGQTIVIDPGDDLMRITAQLKAAPIKEIIATHFHFDHVGALSGLEAATGAPAAMSAIDAQRVDGISVMDGHDIDRGSGAPHIDRRLAEGDEVKVGDAVLNVLETPGHSSGSLCLYCASEKALFAGDTLFAGGRYGRTDFPDGSGEAMIQTLQTKFVGIPDDVRVFSGHGRSSTMGEERTLNPYLR